MGENEESWGTLATVWGVLEPVTGNEQFEAGNLEQVNQYRVEMWYRSDVTTEERISYLGRTFEIESVVNVDERNRKLVLRCKVIT